MCCIVCCMDDASCHRVHPLRVVNVVVKRAECARPNLRHGSLPRRAPLRSGSGCGRPAPLPMVDRCAAGRCAMDRHAAGAHRCRWSTAARCCAIPLIACCSSVPAWRPPVLLGDPTCIQPSVDAAAILGRSLNVRVQCAATASPVLRRHPLLLRLLRSLLRSSPTSCSGPRIASNAAGFCWRRSVAAAAPWTSPVGVFSMVSMQHHPSGVSPASGSPSTGGGD